MRCGDAAEAGAPIQMQSFLAVFSWFIRVVDIDMNID